MRKLVILAGLAMLLGLVAAPTRAAAQSEGDPAAGAALARAICAECHAVEFDQYDSPRPEATAFQLNAEDPKYTELALRAFLRSPHIEMPNLILESWEIADVIAYIRSLDRTEDTPQ